MTENGTPSWSVAYAAGDDLVAQLAPTLAALGGAPDDAHPDLALVGADAVATARARWPHARIVAALGAGSPDSLEAAAWTDDADDVWRLPMSPAVLEARVRRLVHAPSRAEVRDVAQSNRLYRALVRALPDLVWLKDPDGVYLACNPRFESLYGTPEAGIIGKDDRDFVDAELAAFFRANDLAAIARGGPRTNDEWLTFAADGHRELAETIKTPMYGEDGALIGVLGIARDVTRHRADERALAVSEGRLRVFLECFPGGVLVEDADRKVAFANAEFGRLFGIPVSTDQLVGVDCVGREVAASALFADPDAYIAGVRRLVDGVTSVHREPLAMIDGRWSERTFVPILDGGQLVGRVWIYRDVTAERRAAKALEETAEALTHAQSVAHIGSWVLDVPRNHLRWSPETYRIFGVPPSTELFYEAFLAAVHPEDRAYVDASWAAALRGEPYNCLHRVYVNGEVRWVREQADLTFDEQGMAVEGVGTVQDVTAQVRAERALRASEARYRGLFEALPVAVLTLDAHDEVQQVNFAAQVLLDAGPAPLRGRRFTGFLRQADVERFEAERSLADDRSGARSFPLHLRAADGSEALVQATIAAFEREDTVGLQVVLTDLRARQAEEQRQRQLEARVFEMQKQEAIVTLAAGIAHDFNNMLAVIRGRAEALRDASDEVQTLEDLQVVLNACTRGADLTRDLRSLASTGSPRERLDVRRVLDEVAALVRKTARPDVALRVVPPPAGTAIDAESGRLVQALVNLCLNAFEAVRDVGEVVLSATVSGGAVAITVADNGEGMSPEVRRRAIEPFFTTKPRGQGTGLGLSMAQHTAVLFDGTLEIESTVGQGTRISLRLPLSRVPASPSAPMAAATRPLPGGAGEVLVIDDDRAVATSTARLLKSAGQTATVLTSGQEALALVEREPTRFAAAIIDMLMPGWDGPQTARRLRAAAPQLKLIFCTGMVDAETRDRTAEFPDAVMLDKPFGRADMERALRQLHSQVQV